MYYRQCYKALKPAAVFPIEVELGINLGDSSKTSDYTKDDTTKDPSSDDMESEDQSAESKNQDSDTAAVVEDLLLGLDLTDTSSSAALPPPLGSSGTEQ